MSTPVLVLNQTTEREHGRKAQLANISASKAVADIIRTTLGPRSMLKMILDPMGGIVMTNDGNSILREVDVSHPAAKSMIELSRTQDEEVGDGTTSVIILAGEMMSVAQPFLLRNMHPRVIVHAYYKAKDVVENYLNTQCLKLDLDNREELMSIVRSCLGTKFVSRFGDLVCKMAVDATMTVVINRGEGEQADVDIKRYARVEKIPGGMLEDSYVLNGLCLNKNVTHPRMRRRIENPRVILLDCPLEYKKLESQTSIEVNADTDWEKILKMEEDYVENLCKEIISHKPDLVFTEKGVSDLAQHYFNKANISVIRRVRKTDNHRIARVTGATICSTPSEIKAEDVGTQCGLFEIRKIADEYFTFLEQCKEPKACTIMLRGASKDVLNEIERNLLDAMNIVRNIVFDPRIVPGGGSVEMAIGEVLRHEAKTMDGVEQLPFRAIAQGLEVIPRTLIENCGGSTIRLMTELRAKHANAHANGEFCTWGIDGNKGELVDMKDIKVFEPYLVKSQTLKTAIESACMLLRIDDIVSGTAATERGPGQGGGGEFDAEDGTFGDARDG